MTGTWTVEAILPSSLSRAPHHAAVEQVGGGGTAQPKEVASRIAASELLSRSIFIITPAFGLSMQRRSAFCPDARLPIGLRQS